MTSIASYVLILLLSLSLSLLLFTYKFLTKSHDFWKRKGVPYEKPILLLGTLKDVILKKYSIGQYLKHVYEVHRREPYFGIFAFQKPALVICNLDIVKTILVKDFNVFMDHLVTVDKNRDPLLFHSLIALKGQQWKIMRGKLTSTFSSGKMKRMFYLVDKCAKELVDNLETTVQNGNNIEIKDTMARYTTDVIASCAFGIESNSLKNPEAEFRILLKKIFEFSFKKSIAGLCSFFSPEMLKILKGQVIDDTVNNFIKKSVWNTVEYREKNGIVRKDFLDNLIELRKETINDPYSLSVDGDVFTAQAFIFLAAGFETSSSTMTFSLYELSLQPDIQTRLREEVNQVLSKYNNEVTYDALQEMKYLDMVVSETLRKYPILPFLDRVTTRAYELSVPNARNELDILSLPANSAVYIPVLGIHYDPQYYPAPERFDPERFTEENRKNRPQFTFLPFGEGPRSCLGMRFGLMQTKTGLVHILSNFEVEPCEATPIPLILDVLSLTVQVKGTLPLKFKRL